MESEKQYRKDRYKQSNKRSNARKARFHSKQGSSTAGSKPSASTPSAGAAGSGPDPSHSDSDRSSSGGSQRGIDFESALEQAQRLLGTAPMRHAALLQALAPQQHGGRDDNLEAASWVRTLATISVCGLLRAHVAGSTSVLSFRRIPNACAGADGAHSTHLPPSEQERGRQQAHLTCLR